MNEKLQQAMTAARNGQEVEAQLLLTQVLKEDPNETQAWFLLSTLVASEQKKTAYLSKVLALEPDHQMAQKMLGRLQVSDTVEAKPRAEAAPVEREAESALITEKTPLPAAAPISASTTDFIAQEKGDTLPEWLAEEEGIESIEPIEAAAVEPVEEAADTKVPDWLQEEVPESWSEETEKTEEPVITELVKEKTPVPAKAKSEKVKATAVTPHIQKQRRFLTGVLYALITVTVLIFILMVFFAWQSFF